jgi:SsrA-binding protein
LQEAVQRKGYTLIPLEVYLKDGRIKMELGVCIGKHLHDKRDDLAKKDAQRDMERALRTGTKALQY